MGSSSNYAMSNQYKLSKIANYGAWKFRMKNILMQKMFWHLILPELKRSILEQDSVTTSQQRSKVLTIINLLVKDEVIPHISHLESP